MVQTRSQTKKQEEEEEVEACEDCGVELRIGSENNPSDHSIFNGVCDDCREEEEEEEKFCNLMTSSNGWNLVFDNDSYYVVSNNYYNDGGDNYYRFKEEDYGIKMAYRKAIKCFCDKAK